MSKAIEPNPTDIEEIIGDYRGFFLDLFHRLKKAGIDIRGMPINQLLYRAETIPEYERLRDQLKVCCSEFVETEFNGRAVSILVLKDPLILGEGFTVSVIELPAPRPAHMYPSGLESVGVFVGDNLSEFNAQYKNVLTGIKDHGQHCQPAFITFDNQKTVKFYDYTLIEIILLQGWKFEQLSLSPDSFPNKIAEIVNTWQWYLRGVADWNLLIKDIAPKKTSCGPVYELESPIHRPNESFAIADMRNVPFAMPHYHVETEIYFVLQGSGLVVVGGEEQPIQRNSTVIIPQDVAHFVVPERDLVLAVVNTPPFRVENLIHLHEDNEAVKFDKNQFCKLTGIEASC
jgi:mannose-6-phosphate isomerase-like protein (cupin superfamily)/predicted metalloenzyme YecM